MEANDIRLSVALHHAPWSDRRQKVVDLQREQLDGAPGVNSVTVIEADPDLDVWTTMERAWTSGVASDSTHHLVLQDDVALCKDFTYGLRDALSHNPDHVVAPFCSLQMQTEVCDAGKSWMRVKNGLWGQAAVMPQESVGDFLDWTKQHVRPDYPHDDTRVNLYTTYGRGERIWITCPSLVQHLGADDSLIGNNPPIDRTASQYIGENRSARDIDWSVPNEVPTNDRKDLWEDCGDILYGVEPGDGL